MTWYATTGLVLYYLTLPLVQLFYLLFYICRFLLSPLVYIVQKLARLCLLPVRIAARFEVGTGVLSRVYANTSGYHLLLFHGCPYWRCPCAHTPRSTARLLVDSAARSSTEASRRASEARPQNLSQISRTETGSEKSRRRGVECSSETARCIAADTRSPRRHEDCTRLVREHHIRAAR